jgi:hypothetical protein
MSTALKFSSKFFRQKKLQIKIYSMKQIYTLRDSLKKFRNLFFFLFIIGTASLNSYGQGNPVVAKDWTALPEADYMLDVAYQIIDCDGSGVYFLQLHLFNENKTKSKASFKLIISDQASGKFFEYVLSDFPIAFASMLSADCSSTDFANLKVAIPSDYTADKLSVEISYQ